MALLLFLAKATATKFLVGQALPRYLTAKMVPNIINIRKLDRYNISDRGLYLDICLIRVFI